MALITWSDKLSVKIQSIDDQHKKLVDLLNKLNDAMAKGAAKEILKPVLDELISYTKTHFAFEEKLFAQHGYPKTEDHKKEHLALTTKALELQQGLSAGKITITLDTMIFLTDWLSKHIQGTDMQYSGFFIEKGVK